MLSDSTYELVQLTKWPVSIVVGATVYFVCERLFLGRKETLPTPLVALVEQGDVSPVFSDPCLRVQTPGNDAHILSSCDNAKKDGEARIAEVCEQVNRNYAVARKRYEIWEDKVKDDDTDVNPLSAIGAGCTPAGRAAAVAYVLREAPAKAVWLLVLKFSGKSKPQKSVPWLIFSESQDADNFFEFITQQVREGWLVGMDDESNYGLPCGVFRRLDFESVLSDATEMEFDSDFNFFVRNPPTPQELAASKQSINIAYKRFAEKNNCARDNKSVKLVAAEFGAIVSKELVMANTSDFERLKFWNALRDYDAEFSAFGVGEKRQLWCVGVSFDKGVSHVPYLLFPTTRDLQLGDVSKTAKEIVTKFDTWLVEKMVADEPFCSRLIDGFDGKTYPTMQYRCLSAEADSDLFVGKTILAENKRFLAARPLKVETKASATNKSAGPVR